MPRLLTLPPQALATRRQLEQDIGIPEGKMGMLRDLAETAMPAAGPSGIAASMMEPPRQTTMGEALLPAVIGLAPLMLGRPASAAQRRFKDIAMGVRRHLKGTAVVDEAGKSRRVFHGTLADFKEFDPMKQGTGGGGDLYGPGFYFTEDPKIAHGYATLLYSDEAKDALRSLTTAQDMQQYYREALRTNINPVSGRSATPEDLTYFQEQFDQIQPLVDRANKRLQDLRDVQPGTAAPANIRPAFLGIKKPFDVDARPTAALRQKMRDSGVYVSPELGTNADVYEDLLAQFGSKADVNDWLAANGFDGITHIGGKDKDTHRVWIAFSPEQVVPALQEGAPTHFRTRARGER